MLFFYLPTYLPTYLITVIMLIIILHTLFCSSSLTVLLRACHPRWHLTFQLCCLTAHRCAKRRKEELLWSTATNHHVCRLCIMHALISARGDGARVGILLRPSQPTAGQTCRASPGPQGGKLEC